jgi:L-lactate dehydrogenase complex protein LldG
VKDDREAIFSRVRAALTPLPERAAMPAYDEQISVMRKLLAGHDLLEVFTERIRLVNGDVLTDPAELAKRFRAAGWMHGYCDPALWARLQPHFGEGFTVETAFDRTRIDDYAFGITRAAGGIAETGTIVLKDASTSSRLAALAPWVHVAVLSRADICGDLPHAIEQFGTDPNIVWCTGPSKTADIEGILIEGVHGPGVQFALVLD